MSERARARYPDDQGWVVDDQGVRVFYEVYGDSSDAVCMLPPWALMNSRFWRLQIPYLARHFRVIAIDPVVNARWPVAMNIVLREFLEAVRSGAVSGRMAAKP